MVERRTGTLRRRCALFVLTASLVCSSLPSPPVSAVSEVDLLWSTRTSTTLVTSHRVDGRPVFEQVEVATRTELAAALAAARRHGTVVGFEWSTDLEIASDTYDALLWNLEQIAARSAWPSLSSAPAPIVAVIDTGVNQHEDLGDRVLVGFNTITDDTDTSDDNGHGTHVAGTIAATANNDLGVAGVAPHARILPLKALTADGTGSTADVAEAIVWATDADADVINLSLGGTATSLALEAAIAYAASKDVPVVASAGNDGSTEVEYYPAAYETVIAVAATSQTDATPSWSNRGAWVDVAAPGVAIPSTIGTTSYALMSGTSMAAPHVAAQVAILASLYPTASATTLRAWVERSALDVATPGPDALSGAGRIDVAASIALAAAESEPPTTEPPATTPPTTEPPATTPPTTEPPTTTPPTTEPPAAAPPTSDPPGIDPPRTEPVLPLPTLPPAPVRDLMVAVSGPDLVITASTRIEKAPRTYHIYRNGQPIATSTEPRYVDKGAARRKGRVEYAMQVHNAAGGSAVMSRAFTVLPPVRPRISALSVRQRTARVSITALAPTARALCYVDGSLVASRKAVAGRATCTLRLSRGSHRVEIRASYPRGTSPPVSRTVTVR